MKGIDVVMKWPAVYRLWMRTHAEKKLIPIMTHNDLERIRRVLDVGCGPGVNAPHFSHTDYLGIDWNERYIPHARNRYNGQFQVGDVTKLQVPADKRFDFILVNSLLHHIDISATRCLLSHLPALLIQGGHVHIIELVLPHTFCLPFVAARADRGDYPRPINEWRGIFNEYFEEVVFEPFNVPICGIPFWSLVYFKGKVQKCRDSLSR
jgi:SAM-dependent methyltransferase